MEDPERPVLLEPSVPPLWKQPRWIAGAVVAVLLVVVLWWVLCQ